MWVLLIVCTIKIVIFILSSVIKANGLPEKDASGMYTNIVHHEISHGSS